MSENPTTPAPLTPPDCDLQAFRTMPLDIVRLQGSDLVAEQTPEENWAALLLWAGAWHQVPAASIPDSDKWQAKQAGYMMRGRIDPQWDRVKEGALRGFILCADGRLYHTVLAEKANEAWTSRLAHVHGKLADRLRKENKKRAEEGHEPAHVPTFDEWLSAGKPAAWPPNSAGIPPETSLKGEGREGRGKGREDSSAPDGAGVASPPPAPSPSPPAPTPAPPPAGTAADRRKSVSWKAAKSFLHEKGMAIEQAGTFLGALHRTHKPLGDETFLRVIEDMVKERPAEPQPWLTAAFQRAAGERGNRQQQLEDKNLDAGQQWLQGKQQGGST